MSKSFNISKKHTNKGSEKMDVGGGEIGRRDQPLF